MTTASSESLPAPAAVSRAAVRGVWASYVNFGVGLLLSFVLTPIILSGLGPADFGLWNIFTSLNGYFLLADFGLATAVVKYTAEYSAIGRIDALNRLLAAVMFVFAGAAALLVAVGAGLVWVVPAWFNVEPARAAAAQVAFLLIVSSAALSLVVSALANVISGYERVDASRTIATALVLLNAVLTVVCLRAGLGLVGIAAAMLLTTVGAIAAYGGFIRHRGWTVRFWPRRADLGALRAVWPYSLRTVGLGLTARVLYQTGSLVIGSFLGPQAVTPYAVAYRLTYTATFAFSQISSAMMPTFARLFAVGAREELGQIYILVTRLSIGVMVPLGIGLAFAGQDFIVAWVGREAQGPLSVLLVMVAMDFLHALGTPAGLLLQGIGRNRAFIWAETVNAILNLGLSLLLVRPLGTLGVVLGMLAAHLCTSTWVIPLLACRHLDLPAARFIRQGLVPPLLAGVPALAVAWLTRDALAGAGFAGVAVKALAIVALYVPAYFSLPHAATERAYAMRMLRVGHVA